MPAALPPITDLCFLVEDIERSIAFYVEKLGFTLRTRAEGFADFTSEHVALALWETDHIAKHVDLKSRRSEPGTHKALVAVELGTAQEVDDLHDVLLTRGIRFLGEPKDYPWRARCVYFTDPDDNLWELYAWLDGKRFGEISD